MGIVIWGGAEMTNFNCTQGNAFTPEESVECNSINPNQIESSHPNNKTCLCGGGTEVERVGMLLRRPYDARCCLSSSHLAIHRGVNALRGSL